MRSHVVPSLLIALAASLASGAAYGDGLRVHGLGGATLPVGAPQSKEYGVGGGAALALEVPVASVLGLQAEAGAVAQSKAARPADPTLADHGTGSSLFGALGARLRPFGGGGRVAGPWLDANLGLAETGGARRMTFDAHLGHDFRVGGGRFDLGPFVGYTQIVQPADTLRPDDAHVVWLGVHLALGAPLPPAPRPVQAARNEPKPVAPKAEPAQPKREAAPDRDSDTIADPADACPDVPGVATDDPKTNGCPPRSEHVHVEGATIVLDDVIHFESGSPRVRHQSWGILKHVADYITAMDDVLEVNIEGHADIIGTETYNQRLSELRADSVKKLLVLYGVPENKLTTHGHGELKPRVIGFTEVQHRQNRRVEFTITRSRPARDDAPKAPESPEPTAHKGSEP